MYNINHSSASRKRWRGLYILASGHAEVLYFRHGLISLQYLPASCVGLNGGDLWS